MTFQTIFDYLGIKWTSSFKELVMNPVITWRPGNSFFQSLFLNSMFNSTERCTQVISVNIEKSKQCNMQWKEDLLWELKWVKVLALPSAEKSNWLTCGLFPSLQLSKRFRSPRNITDCGKVEARSLVRKFLDQLARKGLLRKETLCETADEHPNINVSFNCSLVWKITSPLFNTASGPFVAGVKWT